MKKYLFFVKTYNNDKWFIKIEKLPWWKRIFKKKKVDIKVL